jgi:hypothetical protein
MVELTGYLDVQVPGTYVLAASSEDRFVLWLQDWWLHMQEAEWGYATWTVRANFTAPGSRCVLVASHGAHLHDRFFASGTQLRYNRTQVMLKPLQAEADHCCCAVLLSVQGCTSCA